MVEGMLRVRGACYGTRRAPTPFFGLLTDCFGGIMPKLPVARRQWLVVSKNGTLTMFSS